jgi:hypothetical protein
MRQEEEVIMTTTSGLSEAGGSLYKTVATVAGGYLVVTGLAAAAAPIFSDRNPAFAVWLVGGLILFITIARQASHRLAVHHRTKRAAVSLLVALGVSLLTVFLGFVVMVNIWERLGLGH